jgi:hypothetical protein
MKTINFDWAIKNILRDKKNFDILEGFLSTLLEKDIKVLELLESESNNEENLKFNRVDLMVSSGEEQFIIEIQNSRETDYLERILFGTSKVIVESLESALRRGANILGEIKGYGFSSNGDHISVPNVDGPKRSLERCLKDANLSPKDIDYVNAHATATPVGDTNEAKALDLVFGNHKPPISSTKSMTGHEMWMGGASEVIYSLLMMHNNFIAPNINFETPDAAARNLNIISQTKEAKIDTFLSNSFGFGGTNSTLIVSKYKI